MDEQKQTEQQQSGEHTSVGSLVGKVIDDRYRVIQKLGQGGMGAVYKAEHLLMHRTIALKVLHPNLADNEDSLKRFLHEAKIASKLSHPNAVTLFDFGVENSMPYIVMEYVQGITLKQIIAEQGALSLERTASILQQIADALSEAHSLGIVHRDLKPDNIMVGVKHDGTDLVNVLDFGIAKVLQSANELEETALTKPGTFFGTPQYMSPEVMSNQLDARSDIYSLGVILYEMLSGEAPFQAPSMMQVLMQHLNEKPLPIRKFKPDTKVPRAIDAIVMKALEKKPDDRYQSVAQLAKDFRENINRARREDSSQNGNAAKPAPLGRLALAASAIGVAALAAYGLTMPRNYGSIQITSTPPQARILLDGEPKGRTPLTIETVAAGDHTLSLQKDGFAEVQVPLTVTAGKESRFNAQLIEFSPGQTAPGPQSKRAGGEPQKETALSEAADTGDKKTAIGEEKAAQLRSESGHMSGRASLDGTLGSFSQNPETVRQAKELFRAGENLLQQKDYMGAAAKFEEALQLRPRYLEAMLSLGVSYLRLHRLGEAQRLFSEALVLDPSYAPTHYNIATCHALSGESEEALSELSLAIDLSPKCKEWAENDSDFKSLRAMPEFKKLID